MKKIFSKASANEAFAATAFLLLSSTSVFASNLTVVKSDGSLLSGCSYSQANFIGGSLKLVLSVDSCVAGGSEQPAPEQPDPEQPDPEQPDPEQPEQPANCTIPADIVWNKNHAWDRELPADVRTPIALKGKQVYSLTINKPLQADLKGSGSMINANTVSASGVRRMMISECPGSMVPVNSITIFGTNACVVDGAEKKLAWSFDSKLPTDFNQCRLDPNKQYYVNISHQNAVGEPTCKSSECSFIYNYKFDRLIK